MPTELPAAWGWTRMGEQFQRVRRKNTAGVSRVLTASGAHGLIDQEEFFNKRVAAKKLGGYYHLKRGEFAYNRSAMKGYPVGAIKRLERYDEGALSTLYLCFALRTDAGILSDYASHLFASGQLDAELRPIARVGARAHGLLNVTPDDFMAVSFPLPPLPEQRKISAVLSAIDEAIQAAHGVVEQTRRVKDGLLQDLLAKGVGHARFKQTEIGELPVTWDVAPLESLTTKIRDGVHRTPSYVPEGVPFVTVRNLTASDGIDLSDTKYISAEDDAEFRKRTDPRAGDVLVSKDGTLGVARVVTADLPHFNIFVSVAQLRPRHDRVLPHLIKAFFDSRLFLTQLGRLSAGSGLKHIHLSHFRQFLLPVPPLDEQQLIVERLGRVDEALSRQRGVLAQLERLRAGLLQDLLTGKVRVTV